MIEFRVPFAVTRQAVDDAERGAEEPDWQPVKDAARTIAMAENGAIFGGYAVGSITSMSIRFPPVLQ